MTLLDSPFGFDFGKKSFLTLQVIASVSQYTKMWTKYEITRKIVACKDVYIVGKCPRTDNNKRISPT